MRRNTSMLMGALAVLLGGTACTQGTNGNRVEVPIDSNDIGGVVTGPKGAEAGVWVIAETDDLGTKYRKTVVTDDNGRYVLPDLPGANYRIRVRGYGLVDTTKANVRPGRYLNLAAVSAPDPKTAAQIFPASYWLSLMQVPAEDAFPQSPDTPPPLPARLASLPPLPPFTGGPNAGRTGPIAPPSQPTQVASQSELLWSIKNQQQRQLGDKATREVPAEIKALGFTNTIEALQYGATAGQMPDFSTPNQHIRRAAAWIDSIAAGAVPATPPRPQGIERNVVVTMWDVSNEVTFIHDLVASDRRTATVNANGKVYGADFHNDGLIELDPVKNVERTIPIPTQIPRNQLQAFTRQTMQNPSIFWGEEVIVDDVSNVNNVTMDEKGRVWMTATVNAPQNPAYCADGTLNRYAAVNPFDSAQRHIAMYDPSSEKWTLIRTCFRTHHISMSTSGPRRVITNPSAGASTAFFGWVDLDTYERTGSEEVAQGWCQLYFDSDGDGRPNRDRIVPGGPYSVQQNPIDGSVWGAVQGVPGALVRLSIGENPPETCVGEMFLPPFEPFPSRAPNAPSGFNPRGIDVDTNGVVWTALASSNHIASFDRRLCDVLTGEAAMTGKHCAKGWKLYPIPGPKLQGVTAEIGSDFNYFSFVDKFGALGLGNNTAMATGTMSDSLVALDNSTGRMVTMRVPYPLGFYTRGMDARIDNAASGWKGRGIWATNGTRFVWHAETGKGTRGQMALFQIRPNPLAK